jgi:hypothetical protein
MKRISNAPLNEELAIEDIPPEVDAAMEELKELFSDPKMRSTASFRCSTEGPTDDEVMIESICGEENSEYRRWIKRLYEFGFISRMPDEWK